MREYMKNNNEYIENGKRYIEKIKRCFCREKIDGEYLLICSIHERGVKSYTYTAGTDFISKDPSKGFYLSESALETAENAVKEFEEAVRSVKSGDVEIIEINNLTVYSKSPAVRANLFVEEYTDKNGKSVTKINECGIIGVLSNAKYILKADNEDRMYKILNNPDEKTITENPFYISAVKSGDERTQLDIKLYYNIATKKDCQQLSELLGARVLPKLSEKYNKGYAIEKNDIQVSLLARSGYGFSHRPNIAMYGSTRSRYTLNPHTRTFVDAAKKDTEVITFDDFLKLFEEEESDE